MYFSTIHAFGCLLKIETLAFMPTLNQIKTVENQFRQSSCVVQRFSLAKTSQLVYIKFKNTKNKISLISVYFNHNRCDIVSLPTLVFYQPIDKSGLFLEGEDKLQHIKRMYEDTWNTQQLLLNQQFSLFMCFHCCHSVSSSHHPTLVIIIINVVVVAIVVITTTISLP